MLEAQSETNLKLENNSSLESLNSFKSISNLYLWEPKIKAFKRKITLLLPSIESRSSMRIGESSWKENWLWVKAKRRLLKDKIKPKQTSLKSTVKVSEIQLLLNLFNKKFKTMKTITTMMMTKMQVLLKLKRPRTKKTKNLFITFRLYLLKHFTNCMRLAR